VSRWRLVVLAPLLLVAAACGSGVLEAGKVADGAEKAFEEQVGVRADVTCPDDLQAEVGAKGHCTANAPGDATTYGVTVTVTEVDGDDTTYTVEVDDEPQD
jgi:hypothetical protein